MHTTPGNNLTDIFIQRVADAEHRLDTISRKYSRLSWSRLAAALAALALFYGYYHLKTPYLLAAGLGLVGLFVLLMKWHQRVSAEKQFSKAFLLINKEELEYLLNGSLPFAAGTEYKDARHAFADDLDLFGNRSLYQHINRTATQMGKQALAAAFLNHIPIEEIRDRQEAIAELAQARDNRHELYASGKLAQDNEDIKARLLQWSQEAEKPLNKAVLVLAYLLPALLAGVLLLYILTKEEVYKNAAFRLFPLNLFVFSFQVKRIKRSLFSAGRINEMLQAYAAILQKIENSTYQSPLLIALQQQLKVKDILASTQLQKLSSIYAGMETIQNPFSAIFTNGLYLYHLHMLQRLIRWKQQYAALIPGWLELIGTMEMLNSLANFSDINPAFCFPELNEAQHISFEALGHPLLKEEKRICNDIGFDEHRFIILTGSNMSGKSTFLRTLGVNMILAGMGTVVCARRARVHPLPVFVSMRQSDSLADSESYFFAEVKRLQYIMEQMDQAPAFVLLDEILRGTNSDDKRSGTIGVVEKIIKKKVYGAIATHDLEVCLTTEQHPDTLSNKCFEVEIIQDELVFDYKLRSGICRNKSATFLMKKMGII